MFPSEKVQDAILEGIKQHKFKNAIAYFICWLLILGVFWFVAIYLVGYRFYARTPIPIIVAVSFCLGFASLLSSIAFMLTSFKNRKLEIIFLFSGLYAVIPLGSMTTCWILSIQAASSTDNVPERYKYLHIFNFTTLVIIVLSFIFIIGGVEILINYIEKIRKSRKGDNEDREQVQKSSD